MSEKMANPRKGEAIITIDDEEGNPEEYKLRYNFGVIVGLQKATGKTVDELFTAMGKGDFGLVVKIVHAGIVKGKSWPKRFGVKAPSQEDLLEVMLPCDSDEYFYAIAECLKGAEFSKKLRVKQEAAIEKALEGDLEG